MERRQFLRNAGVLLGSLWSMEGLALGNDYKVNRGDTLSAIAHRFKTTVSQLKRLNRLSSDRILVGQSLKIRQTLTSSLPQGTLKSIHRAPINRGKWKHIVVHHSATRQGNAKSFHNAHLRRGMENGLAYHFVIGNGSGAKDGLIETGRRWQGQLNGGHVKNSWYNGNSIGICLVGNFEKTRPTEKQLTSLNQLVEHLKYGKLFNNQLRLLAHREIKGEQTLCPGKLFDIKALHRKFG
jgi:LysM repeat protein